MSKAGSRCTSPQSHRDDGNITHAGDRSPTVSDVDCALRPLFVAIPYMGREAVPLPWFATHLVENQYFCCSTGGYNITYMVGHCHRSSGGHSLLRAKVIGFGSRDDMIEAALNLI